MFFKYLFDNNHFFSFLMKRRAYMKSKYLLMVFLFCICIVSTVYSFLYLGLLWFDYFTNSVFHRLKILSSAFLFFGLISLFISLPVLGYYRNNQHLQLSQKSQKALSVTFRINAFVIIINIISVVIWVGFIIGPSV